MPSSPHGWRPAEQARRDSHDILLQAWTRLEFRKLAARRTDFAHLAGGVDRWASRQLLASNALSAEAAGALRTVLSGNVVTETLAAKSGAVAVRSALIACKRMRTSSIACGCARLGTHTGAMR